MYRLLRAFLACLALVVPASAQFTSTARHIRWGSSLPAVCSPLTGDVFFKTAATVGIYECLVANTWTLLTTGTIPTIPSVTNLLSGDGAGNAADSGIASGVVVKASAPGVGIAHFAGSTQTVTSSPVTNAELAYPLIAANNSLTDNGTTIATNAALGNNFRVTALTANVTLSNPTNPVDGQTVTWEVIQNASAAKTLAFGANFGFGAEITACTISTTLSSHNFITAIYNSTTTKWYVRGCITGY